MRASALLGAILSLALIGGARAAITFTPVAPAARSFHVGNLTLTALHDAQIIVPNDGKTFGLGVSPSVVGDVLRAAGAPVDHITLSANALLVRAGKRLVLIDTGLGPRQHGALPDSLKLAGVSPADVTDVLITHPHSDHIGGLLDAQGRLAFPNAVIRMSSAAWSWMRQTAPVAMVTTVAPRIQTFEPGATVAPGISSVPLPGHTPGHVGYQIISGRSRLIDTGDLAHSSIVSLARPQWQTEFDADRDLARKTRVKTLAQLAKSGEWVFAPHFPFPGVGHIVARRQGFALQPGLP
jgi:glyoxylase-like metal-dependent hydrolase (beta-lactamase superfamily II)